LALGYWRNRLVAADSQEFRQTAKERATKPQQPIESQQTRVNSQEGVLVS